MTMGKTSYLRSPLPCTGGFYRDANGVSCTKHLSSGQTPLPLKRWPVWSRGSFSATP
jgi:hypothetical protein